MDTFSESTCPGCGLQLPISEQASNTGYFNASAECWELYTEVLGVEYSHFLLMGQAHQLTVDTYAVQHPGGPHPDKSIAIHLAGLHLVLERGLVPATLPPLLQQLADRVLRWPHFPPPPERGTLTIFDVALSDAPEAHLATVREWAKQVWQAWSPHHEAVSQLVDTYLARYGRDRLGS